MRTLKADLVKTFLKVGTRVFFNEKTPIGIHREVIERLGQLAIKPVDVKIREERIGHLVVDWHEPEHCSPRRILYYLHGGGFMIFSKNTHRGLVSRIARTAAARALVINYRHAPEYPFPAPIEDAVMGYRWLLEQGHQPRDIVVAGDSAGGGLALSLVLALREENLPLPAALALLSPWVDLTASGDSMRELAERDVMFRPSAVQKFAAIYLNGADPLHPWASPLFADLSGLPPVLITVTNEELLFDDARRLHTRLQELGVPSELDIYEGMFHVWQALAPHLEEANESIERIGAFLEQHTADATPQLFEKMALRIV